ncbi:hypothetical protein [Clostridium felsineum]|uniref:hypothetical protein n=1 Tax=Clostridium felsineum TaxID=36839 RepID=UPI002034A693|nr:hypothetical protein [Clostridium felsineum]
MISLKIGLQEIKLDLKLKEKKYSKKLGFPEDKIFVIDEVNSTNTSIMYDEYLIINNVTVRNEYNTALDEAQASIRVARFTSNLTSSERYTLLRDAVNRLKNGNLKINDVRNSLDILER